MSCELAMHTVWPPQRVIPRSAFMERYRSFGPDAGRSDHLGPFLGFVGNKVAEVGGRARKDRAAQADKLRLQLGIGESGVDFSVELLNNLGRCLPGCAGTVK